MRFMVLVPAGNGSEEGVLPDEKWLTEMNKFNEELVKAGVNWLPSMDVVLTKVE